jgi:hypothetical protein
MRLEETKSTEKTTTQFPVCFTLVVSKLHLKAPKISFKAALPSLCSSLYPLLPLWDPGQATPLQLRLPMESIVVRTDPG